MVCDHATVAGRDGNTSDDEVRSEPLGGGWQTVVVRVGDTVRRTASPWSPAVLALLRHLELEGCAWSPRLVGSGFDAEGNECLTFIEGESLQPAPWDDAAIGAVGVMLADFHRAAATFRPLPDAVWKDWFIRRLGRPERGFGHGDLGPWNVMAVDGRPTGMIDWDSAGPMDPMYDLAQAAWLNVQLHDDDVGELAGLGSPAERARQLRSFLDGYGLSADQRRGFVEKMIEVAIADAADQASTHGVGPDTTSGVADNGYPFAWGMAWRARAARWMLEHRTELERSIGAPG